MLSAYKFLTIVILLFAVFTDYVRSQSCTSSVKCISIYDCPPLLSQITSTLSTAQTDYLRSLACRPGTGRYPHVCCPISGNNEEQSRPVPSPSSTGQDNVLPGVDSCGAQSSDDKLLPGNDVALNDFPWMALLEYSNVSSQARILSCGGVLINQRYVLTAAHCLIGKIEQEIGQLVNVRLGEYDLTTTTDCINSDCADPVQNIGIEEIIPHPGFNDDNGNRTNDIGLVRLSRNASYSDFVKPICLPSSISASRSNVTDVLQVAGWGPTINSGRSDKKQKLALPIFDHTCCREKFATATNTFIDDTQLCAGGTFVNETCRGDSGGPAMKFSNNNWVVEGIFSFGLACLEGWPGVYTRVSSFENWIKSTVRP